MFELGGNRFADGRRRRGIDSRKTAGLERQPGLHHGRSFSRNRQLVQSKEGEWAILEWRDPLGLRGCGFFRVVNDQIVFQRGYWDRLAFLRLHKLPVPAE